MSHRILDVGRDFCTSSGPTLLVNVRSIRTLCPGSCLVRTWMSLRCSQTTHLGNLFWPLSQSKNIFYCAQFSFSVLQFVATHPVTGYNWEETASSFLILIRYLKTLIRSPRAISSQNSSESLGHFSYGRSSSLSICSLALGFASQGEEPILPSPWPLSCSSQCKRFSLCWEAQFPIHKFTLTTANHFLAH